MWDEPSASGRGWKRVIKYTKGEYEGFVARVSVMVERLGFRADELERVAWVLGREGVDVGAGGAGEEVKHVVKDQGKDGKKEGMEGKEIKAPVKKAKGVKEPTKQGVKRKAMGTETPVEGLRRSTRRKM